MVVFLALLLLALLAVGLYAAQNPGTQAITLGPYHWTGVADWVPVVVAAGAVSLLLVLYMAYAGARSGLRHGALRRRITTHEGTIADLRKETQRLREENARLKSELRTARPSGPPTDVEAPALERRELPAGSAAPTLGDRVRSFFDGREPAGY